MAAILKPKMVAMHVCKTSEHRYSIFELSGIENMICHQFWLHRLLRTKVIWQIPLEMAAILKSKMAAIPWMEKNVINGFLIAEGILYPMTPKKASLAKKNALV